MSRAPSAQLIPTLNGRACAIVIQKASIVWPARGAPAAVGDGHRDHQGQADARLLGHVLDRDDRRLGVEAVDDRLHQQQVGAAVDQAAHLLGVRRAQLVEGDRRAAGSSTSGEIDSMRLVGPMAPATKRGLSGVSGGPLVGRLPGQAGALDVELVGPGARARSRPARRWWC